MTEPLSNAGSGHPQGDLVVAADLGGTNLRTALIDRDAQILHRLKHPTPHTDNADDIVRSLVAAVKECSEPVANGGRVVGVCVAIPGTVHAEKGTVMNAPNIPCLDGFNLGAALQSGLGSPVLIENDANAATVGEMWQGAAREVGSFIMITLGTGIGGGVILDRKLWSGIDGTAGELGHIGVEREGHPCGCGSRGCVEQYASATAIVRQARELMPQYPASSLATADPLTAQAIFQCGQAGDEMAREVFRRAGLYLGMALASLVNALNPEMIVIGGGVAAGWDLFIEHVRGQIMARAFPEPAKRAQVVRAVCGDDAGLLGAAHLAFQNCGGG